MATVSDHKHFEKFSGAFNCTAFWITSEWAPIFTLVILDENNEFNNTVSFR